MSVLSAGAVRRTWSQHMQRVGYFVASTVATRKAAAASRDRAVSAERGWPLTRDRRDERAVR